MSKGVNTDPMERILYITMIAMTTFAIILAIAGVIAIVKTI
jgi:hypothetical protein